MKILAIHSIFGDDGAIWVAKPVKVWNGTAWVIKPLKRYNGTSWVETDY